MHKAESMDKQKGYKRCTHLLVLKQCGDLVLDRGIRVSYACFYCPGLLANLCPLFTHLPPFSHEGIHITNDRHEFSDVSRSERRSRAFALGLGSDGHIRRGSVSIRLLVVVINPGSSSDGLEELSDCGQIR